MANFGAKTPTIRAALLERDGDACAYCGKASADTPEGRLAIDHKTPPDRGGTDELDNLQLLCNLCNTGKGQQTEEEAQRAVRFGSSLAAAGFTVAYNTVLFDRSLSTSARLLYFQLRHYGWLCEAAKADSPQQVEIAGNLGVKERALRPYIAELVDAGLLRTHQRGRGMSNVYTVLEPKAPGHDRQNTAGLDRHSATDQTGSLLPLSRGRDPLKDKDVKKGLPDGSPHKGDRDAIYRALLEAVYGDADVSLTPVEKRRGALAANELLAAGATPEEVGLRARRYRQHPTYKEMALTVMAIKSHWGELADSATGKTRAAGCEECHIAGGRHAEGCSLAPPPPPPDSGREAGLEMARRLSGAMPSD